MEGALDVVLLVLFFPAVLGVAWFVAGRQRRGWQALSQELGWPIAQGERSMFRDERPLRGSQGRWQVQLRTYTVDGGDNHEAWFALEVAVQAASPALRVRVTRQGLGDALAKALGGQDLELGDPEFDRRWRVQASGHAEAHRILGPFARAALEQVPKLRELRVEALVPLKDGRYLEPRAAEGAAKVLAQHPQGLGAKVARGLVGEPAGPPVCVARCLWKGRVEAAQVRAALPLVVMVAEGAEAAAPRAPA